MPSIATVFHDTSKGGASTTLTLASSASADRYQMRRLGQMYAAIDGAKPDIMSAVSNASRLILGELAPVYCDDVYLLPGKQPNAPATRDGIVLQDALSDVTIVLENQH